MSRAHPAEDATNEDIEIEDGMIVEEQEEAAAAADATEKIRETPTAGANTGEQAPTEPRASPSSAPPLPPHLVGAVQDEGLKNLLMSWYYAGYYTGLYEGQQKGQQMAKSANTANAP